MIPSTTINFDRIFRFLAYAWVFIFAFLWQYNAAPMYDDISYSRMALDKPQVSFWEGEGKQIETWGEVWESSINHYKNINGRLTNILMFFTVLLPSGVSAFIMASLISLMFWAIIKAAEQWAGKPLSSAVVWLTAALMWLWFQWNDSMISMDYALNYVTPTFTTLIFSLAFLSNRQNSLTLWLGITAGFLTGWLHEGFSLPLIAASAIYLIFYNVERKNRGLMLLALVAGACICIINPATFIRIAEHSESKGFIGGIRFIINNLKEVFLQFAVMFVLGVILFIKQRKRFFTNGNLQYILFWGSACIGSVAISIVLKGSGRVLWLASLCLLVATLGFLRELTDCKRIVNSTSSIFIMALCILWTCGVIKTERKISATQQELISQLKANKNGIVYVDLYRMRDIPWWTFGLLHQYAPTTLLWNLAYNYSLHQHPLILPTHYMGKGFEEWDKLLGNNPYRGFDDFWYSKEKIEEGTTYRATMGEKTAKFAPWSKDSQTAGAYTAEPMFAIDEKGDTLWISLIFTPYTRELVKLDSNNAE